MKKLLSILLFFVAMDINAQPGAFFGQNQSGSTPKRTYAHWTNASSDVTIDSDTTCHQTNDGLGGGAQSDLYVTTGQKIQVELTLTTKTSDNFTVGVVNAGEDLTQYVGKTATGWGLFINGGYYYHADGFGANVGGTIGANVVIDILIDKVNNEVSFMVNGVSFGVAHTSVTGNVYVAFSGFQTTNVIKANWGKNPFAFPQPGYRGFYN